MVHLSFETTVENKFNQKINWCLNQRLEKFKRTTFQSKKRETVYNHKVARYDEKGAQQCERAREWSIEGMLGR